MRIAKPLFIISAAMLSGTVSASYYVDHAKVIDVDPVYHYASISDPEEVCYPVEHRRSRHDPGSTIVGAIVGGVIGNALARNSRSRGLATVAGATLGGSIGSQVGYKGEHVGYSQQCELDYTLRKEVRTLHGYDVTYRYQGKTYHIFTKNYPGKRIKVKVNLIPIDD